ncbi:hypothetical protein [Streptomyces tibetensis]|uniref:hypothetical protein n=1 Tax=Streptomyces tibetensis TaxID=2382123 RepID=UPI0033D987E5
MRLAAARYGTSVVTAAEKLPIKVFGLLGKLALARRDGDTRSVVDLLTEWARPLCPDELWHRWPVLLRGILRRSGVLVPFGEDFTFLHQTIADFLAVQHIGQDEDRSDREFAELFDSGRSHPGRIARLASKENSFARFLVASWIDRRRTGVEEGLHECAGQFSGASFIADLTADRVRLGPTFKQTAIDTLLRAWDASRSPHDFLDLRVDVAVTLAWKPVGGNREHGHGLTSRLDVCRRRPICWGASSPALMRCPASKARQGGWETSTFWRSAAAEWARC